MHLMARQRNNKPETFATDPQRTCKYCFGHLTPASKLQQDPFVRRLSFEPRFAPKSYLAHMRFTLPNQIDLDDRMEQADQALPEVSKEPQDQE